MTPDTSMAAASIEFLLKEAMPSVEECGLMTTVMKILSDVSNFSER